MASECTPSPLPFSILNRNAVTPHSPGLPLRLPWDLSRKNYSTAKRLRHFLGESKIGATALRLGFNESLTQGSRSRQPWAEGQNRVAVRRRLPDPAGHFQSSPNPFVSRQRSRKLLAS